MTHQSPHHHAPAASAGVETALPPVPSSDEQVATHSAGDGEAPTWMLRNWESMQKDWNPSSR